MRIRLLKQKDIEEVVKLIIESYKKEDKSRIWTENIAREYLRRIYKLNREVCFVAQEGEKIIGVALCRIRPEFNKIKLISDMLLVHPEYRKKKVATKLLNKLLTKAKNKFNVTEIETSIYTLLDFPIIWYESIGFRKLKNIEILSTNIEKVIKLL